MTVDVYSFAWCLSGLVGIILLVGLVIGADRKP